MIECSLCVAIPMLVIVLLVRVSAIGLAAGLPLGGGIEPPPPAHLAGARGEDVVLARHETT